MNIIGLILLSSLIPVAVVFVVVFLLVIGVIIFEWICDHIG